MRVGGKAVYIPGSVTHNYLIFTDANVGLGVYIYNTRHTDFDNLTLLWIYLGFAAFSVILACGLFAVFTGEAVICKIDGELVTVPLLPAKTYVGLHDHMKVQMCQM